MNKLLILAVFLFVGCYNPDGKEIRIENNNTKPNANYRIVQIDGCEYIEVEDGTLQTRVYSLTHKGNCKNSIHGTQNH